MHELEELTKRAQTGSLTPAHLNGKVGLYYDDEDNILRSVGAAWIIRNPGDFGKMCCAKRGKDRGYLVSVFLRAHFDTPHVIELLLCHVDVLRELSDLPTTARFVCDAYIHCGARNNGWICAARLVGVSDNSIRGAIMERLRRTERVQPMRVNEATDFVGSGAGATMQPREQDYLEVSNWRFLDKNAPWTLFADDKLKEALLLCAEKAPKETLQQARTIAARLGGWIQAHHVLTHAMANLTSVLHLDPRILALFPGPSKSLAYRLQYVGGNDTVVTIKFLVQTYLALDKRHDNLGAYYAKAMQPILDRMPAYVLYRHMHTYALDERLWDYVNYRLKVDGFVVGNVRRTTYHSRTQWSVNLGIVRYVLDRHQHRYMPREGDLVAIDTNEAVPLPSASRRVFRAMFNPLTRDLRD